MADEEEGEENIEQSDSNSTCTICMEEWTLGSSHRLCCLKCGHLFGRSCIERWIKEKGQQAKCPTCNKSAKKIDLRDIWCRAIKATDDTEFYEIRRALEHERDLRKQDSAVLFHQTLKLEMQDSEIDKLKRDLMERDRKITRLEALLDRLNNLSAQRGTFNGTVISIDMEDRNVLIEDLAMNLDAQPRELKGMFRPANQRKIESSPLGQCKAIAVYPASSILLVAQPALPDTPLMFRKFGLRKFSTLDINVREFIPLHTKTITSIQLKPIGDLVLSASLDKKVKLTSINNNTCVQEYDCQFDPTCVAWSEHRDQQFYVGTGNCYVSLYDIRNTSEFIYRTSQRVAQTRLLSLASTARSSGLAGIIVNDAKGSQFLEVSESSDYNIETIDFGVEHMKSHNLPFGGLMGSVDFDQSTGMALITTRRSPVNARCTHNLIKLKKVATEDEAGYKVECENIRTFYGGATELLTQSRILKHPTVPEQVLVGACDGSARGIKLWDASDDTEYQSLIIDANDFVRDIVSYSPHGSNQHVLYALSDRSIYIYHWDYA